MFKRQLVPVDQTSSATNRELEGGIQPGTAAQQFGIFDAAGVCGAGSPFAFLNDRKAGAQAVKAKMHSLRSALTAFRAGHRFLRGKQRGQVKGFLFASFSGYDW